MIFIRFEGSSDVNVFLRTSSKLFKKFRLTTFISRVILFEKRDDMIKKSVNFMNDFLWMAEKKMHVHMDRAYRSTFMAWKTCRSPLKASAENLPDIFIHSLKTMCIFPRDSVLHIRQVEWSSPIPNFAKFSRVSLHRKVALCSLHLSFYPFLLRRLTITRRNRYLAFIISK